MHLVRKLSVPLLIFSLLGFITGCGPWGSTQPTVKIGLVAPFEGLYRPLGYEVLSAVKLAISERNQAGGVKGHMVELVALNDDQDPTVAVRRAREMAVDQDVVGVIGHFGEQTTLAVLSSYCEAGLALVVPASTATDVTESGCGQTFRLVADDGVLGAAAARYAVMQRGASRLAVIGGSVDLVDSFASRARQEGALVSQHLDDDRVELLAALESEGPDMIFFGGEALEGAELLLELRAAGLDIPLLGSNGLNSPYFVQVAGNAAVGTAYLSITPPLESERFSEGYVALAGGPPGPHAALAYDAARLLLDAVERSIAVEGRATREAVVVALSETEEYEGLTGRISFDERGQAREPRIYIYEIVDGKYPGQLQSCPDC